MASGHETNLINDPNYSSSSIEYLGGNLNDSSLPHEENVKSSFDSNKDSQPLFHQQHGNDPTVPQNLHSSHHQPVCSEMKQTPLNSPQTQNLSDVLESSQSMCHKSSENVSGLVPDSHPQPLSSEMKPTPVNSLQPNNLSDVLESSQSMCHKSSENVSGMVPDKRSETRFSGNEDAVSHIPSGKDSVVIRNNRSSRQDLDASLPSDIEGSRPTTIQWSETVPTANQQFPSDSNTTQQMHTQTELDANEFNFTQSSYPSVQLFAERNSNGLQGYDSQSPEQCPKESIASQISYPLSQQPHQNVSEIGQTAHTLSKEVIGNKSILHQTRDNSDYFLGLAGPRRFQDLPSQSFLNSLNRYKDIQSSYPQGIRQSENDPNMINMYSSSHPASTTNLSQDCGLYSSTREFLNQKTANQDLHSLNIEPVERETHDNHQLHPLPQTLRRNTNKRHLPNTHSEQEIKRGSYSILLEESQPNTSDHRPLVGKSPKIDRFLNEIRIISQYASTQVFEKYMTLNLLQGPYSNRSELINILVSGPPDDSKCFLQTFSGINTLEFGGPHSFALKQNFMRCGILMAVYIWKIDKMSQSVPFLESRLFTRCTIIFVCNVMNADELLTLKRVINSLRESTRNIPIILVKRKPGMGISNKDNLKEGFKFKAKYDFSAYLEFSPDSKAEAEAVMLTALDVSFL